MAKRRQNGSKRQNGDATRKRAAKGGDGRVLRRLARWALVSGIWAVVFVLAALAWFAYDLPDIESLQSQTRRPQITLLAADGSVIARQGDVYGRAVQMQDVPPFLVQAIIAVEDRRFFRHSGFDPWAVLRAAYVNARYGEIRQGGSTLTQQLAKNLFLDSSRTLRRKVQELLIALWLEAKFDKRQIFTIYMNRVYMGGGTYGVDAASRHYFGVPARNISVYEAAILAGLLKAPSRYAPSHNPDGAKRRARQVLNAMVDAGFLTPEEARKAARRKPRLVQTAAMAGGRYFADWVMKRVSGYAGGIGRDLVVRTTLDPRLQKSGEQRFDAIMKKRGEKLNAAQGALVAMSPDGAVRAMVGGRDYNASQFNRATQSLRQPGSAFKLFVYLAALESGMTPDDMMSDAPVAVGKWKPKNFNKTYRGMITLRQALASSVNTVAVRVSERVGRDKVVAAARRLGITSPIKGHPSVALGVSEVSLMELTAAYATLPNGGWGVWPYAIADIRDKDGTIIYQRRGSGPSQVIEREPLNAMHDMLSAVVLEGTGRRAAFTHPAAGKTGTSQDFRDAWFVGYAGGLVAGVWVGNDDDTPMKRVTGGNIPADIWRSFMTDALRGVRPQPRVAETTSPALNLLPALIDRVLQERRERMGAPPRVPEPPPARRSRPTRDRWTPPAEDNPDYQP